MSVFTRDAERSARSSGVTCRRHALCAPGRAAMVASIMLVPMLGGCSFGSPDSASLPRQTPADRVASASPPNPVLAVAPPPLPLTPEPAGAPGVPSRAASPTYAANVSAPPVGPPAYAANAPAAASGNAAVPSASPPTAGNASAAPGTSPQPTENPFYAIYDSLKDNGPQCAMPTESCDNIHRIQN